MSDIESGCRNKFPFREVPEIYKGQLPFDCRVSFKLTNLTSDTQSASYVVRSKKIVGSSHYRWRSVSTNFEKTGAAKLKANETQEITLSSESPEPTGIVTVETWIN